MTAYRTLCNDEAARLTKVTAMASLPEGAATRRSGARRGCACARSRFTVVYVIAAVALAGAVLFIVAGLAWTARLVHIGTLDALALAEKMAVPDPVSALDWPELHVRAVIPQPGEPSLVLLLVGWPSHRGRVATLLVDLGRGDQRSLPLLSRWCARQASISPARRADGELELRRRQSLERVRGLLLAEDATPASSGSKRPGPGGRPG